MSERGHTRLWACAAAALLLLPAGAARAGGFSILPGEIITQGQLLEAPGDIGLIARGGQLVVEGDTAITALDNGNRIVNGGYVFGYQSISAGNQNDIRNTGIFDGSFDGIVAQNDNRIINSGRITAQDLDAIRVDSGNLINNIGLVEGGLTGISMLDGNRITNSGTIRSADIAILASSGNTIITKGTLSAPTAAVQFDGDGNTLKLLKGSKISGLLLLGDDNKLVIGHGLSTALRYAGTPHIHTSGNPYIISDDVLAVVDSTVFKQHDGALEDLTRTLANVIADRQPNATGAWSAGTAGTSLATLLMGADRRTQSGVMQGIFAGFSRSYIEDTNYFAGAYAVLPQASWSLGLSLTGGITNQSTTRTIVNNMIASGSEQARAKTSGIFLNPSATLSTTIEAGRATLTPSLRLIYAGLFLGSTTETGSTAALRLNSRSVHLLNARAALTSSLPEVDAQALAITSSVTLGADGTAFAGRRADARVMGQDIDVGNLAGSDSLRAFAAFNVDVALSPGSHLLLGGEAGYDTSSQFSAEASLAIAIPF